MSELYGSEPRVLHALVTCPWCDWAASFSATDRALLEDEGRLAAERHTREAGHAVKAGRRPRIGYCRGRPVQ